MSAVVASLEDFLAKRQATQARLTPAARVPLAGLAVYSDGAFRMTHQLRTPADFAAFFAGLSAACDAALELQKAATCSS